MHLSILKVTLLELIIHGIDIRKIIIKIVYLHRFLFRWLLEFYIEII